MLLPLRYYGHGGVRLDRLFGVVLLHRLTVTDLWPVDL